MKYIMKEALLKRLKKSYDIDAIVCYSCGKPILKDEVCVSKVSRGHAKRFHQSCWENCFIDLED